MENENNRNQNKKEDIKISTLVENVLNNINKKLYDYKGLLNLYNNASNHKSITEYEKEVLIEKIVSQLKTRFPKQSSRMFGNKSTEAIELLTKLLSEIKSEFDWISKNKVGDHVKPGGSMMRGDDYVCHYISYKNEDGIRAGIAVRQEDPEKPLILDLEIQEVGKGDSGKIKKIYQMEDKENCIRDFKLYLKKIIK